MCGVLLFSKPSRKIQIIVEEVHFEMDDLVSSGVKIIVPLR
jgi:hypothetical protein